MMSLSTPKKPKLSAENKQELREKLNSVSECENEIVQSKNSVETQTPPYFGRPRYKGQDPWPKLAHIKICYKDAKNAAIEFQNETIKQKEMITLLQQQLRGQKAVNAKLG